MNVWFEFDVGWSFRRRSSSDDVCRYLQTEGVTVHWHTKCIKTVSFEENSGAVCAHISNFILVIRREAHHTDARNMDGGETFWIFENVINQYSEEVERVGDFYVEKIANNQPNAIGSPIVAQISIDYEKWATVPEWKLALETLLNEPLQSQKDIEMCVWLMIYSSLMQRYPRLTLSPQLSQIHCIIRISNLPISIDYEFAPYRHPIRLSLSIMKCVLFSYGDCCASLRQTIWHCPKYCANSKNLVINEEHTSMSNDKRINKCLTCNETLHEYEVKLAILAGFDSLNHRNYTLCFVGVKKKYVHSFFSIVGQHTCVAGFRCSMLNMLKHLPSMETCAGQFV